MESKKKGNKQKKVLTPNASPQKSVWNAPQSGQSAQSTQSSISAESKRDAGKSGMSSNIWNQTK